MKYIKMFEDIDEITDFDYKMQFYGSDTYILFSFAEMDIPVTLIEEAREVESLIEKYKETYIRNKEWGGGPPNQEFCNYFSKFVNRKVDRYSPKVNKPLIYLNIHTEVGLIILGFSIPYKKCVLINWGDYRNQRESGYFQRVHNGLLKWTKENIFNKGLSFDEVIKNYEINIKVPVNWNSFKD